MKEHCEGQIQRIIEQLGSPFIVGYDTVKFNALPYQSLFNYDGSGSNNKMVSKRWKLYDHLCSMYSLASTVYTM